MSASVYNYLIPLATLKRSSMSEKGEAALTQPWHHGSHRVGMRDPFETAKDRHWKAQHGSVLASTEVTEVRKPGSEVKALTVVTSPVQRCVALVVFEIAVLFRLRHLEQLTQPCGMAPSSRIVQGCPPSGIFTED